MAKKQKDIITTAKAPRKAAARAAAAKPAKVAPAKKLIKKPAVKKPAAKKTVLKKAKKLPAPKKTAKAVKLAVLAAPVKAVDQAPKVKVVAKSASVAGYTPDQYEKYKSEIKRLSGYSNARLKEILKKNLQSMSGNKDEMIAKIADGVVLGRIPRCPACFGGRPKFDYKTGKYSCSGYRDDTDFINCHKTFTLAQIIRDKWEE